MARFKFTTIGHAEHLLCSPISDQRLDGIIESLDMSASDRVIDIAAGKAEVSIRLIERYGLCAVAVEQSEHFIDAARAEAARRIPDGRLTLVHADAREYESPPGSFDLAICIGARPWESRRDTLRALAKLVRPGGRIFIGEGYWRREPDPEFLAFLGCSEDDYTSHEGNVAVGVGDGFTPLHSVATGVEELDDYDGRYRAAIERYVREHPDDPDTPEIHERIGKWREAYFKWLRNTPGFGLYVFRT